MDIKTDPQFADDYFRMLGCDWTHEKPHRRLINLLTKKQHETNFIYI